MAWCTSCDENREIVYRTEGDSRAVPTTTQRYNRDGVRIGCEEGEAYETTIVSTPVCPWCGTFFLFPRAQSKEQYFNAKKQDVISRWRAKRPANAWGCGCWTEAIIFASIWGVVVAVGMYLNLFVLGESTVYTFVSLIVGTALGVVGVIVWHQTSSKRKKGSGETITPEMQAWQEKLHHLMTLPYTEANYQYLRDWRP